MKKFLMATAAAALTAGTAYADGHEVKLGIILGFTGPIESLTPHMADGAEMAMTEVTDSGKLLDGTTVDADPRRQRPVSMQAPPRAAAERLITSDGVKGIMGADCSGVTGAILPTWRVAQRHGDDFALGHIAGSVDHRRQRPVLPHRPVGCASGCGDDRDPDGSEASNQSP